MRDPPPAAGKRYFFKTAIALSTFILFSGVVIFDAGGLFNLSCIYVLNSTSVIFFNAFSSVLVAGSNIFKDSIISSIIADGFVGATIKLFFFSL